jgi:beta-glucosidase
MMTPTQKAAQMIMPQNGPTSVVSAADPGAVFSGGGPAGPTSKDPASWAAFTDAYRAAARAAPLSIPIFYGLDVVHGNNATTSSTIFPHNAGLGSSRDPALVQAVYNIAAQEALAVGINWTFGPFSGVVWDYRWGRVYESFGGDPTLVADLVRAAVIGFQGPGGIGSGTPGVGGAVACAKHFAGDGQMGPPSHNGGVVDRGVITVDLPTMTTWGINPYIPAIQAGLGCIMVSDATWNGVSLTMDSQMITTILKGQLGFKGFVISDWDAGDARTSVRAGVDMLMHPDTWAADLTAIAAMYGNPPDAARIDDAVTRILNVKCQAGLSTFKRGDPSTVGAPEHRALARKAVAASLVLLQNTGNVLPLSKTANTFVTGSGADNLDHQCGGWTLLWQGDNSSSPGNPMLSGATTIRAAISKVAPQASSMGAADAIVVVLSEHSYAETPGDSPTLDTLPPSDFALLAQARATGKPVVALVLSGRPVLLHDMTMADAWVAAWLPGSEGDGVADVLFGDAKPTGKLSHNWPASDAEFRVTLPVSSYTAQFKIGYGLTYP